MDERYELGGFDPTRAAAADAAAADDAFAGLSALLWHEREVLELLLFKLTAQQLILRAGELRWVAASDAEVRAALQRLREFDVLRALETQALARALGVSEDASLREVAQVAPEPWASLLADHRQALQELTAQVAATTETNRRLLESGAAAARETLAAVGALAGTTATYGATGAPVSGPTGPVFLDRHA